MASGMEEKRTFSTGAHVFLARELQEHWRAARPPDPMADRPALPQQPTGFPLRRTRASTGLGEDLGS